MAESDFVTEHIAEVPRGFRVKTLVHPSGHEVRLAFPPGPRRKGSGKLISILHPHGNPACEFLDDFLNPSRQGEGWNRSSEKYRKIVLKDSKLDTRHSQSDWNSLPREVRDRLTGKRRNPFDTPREKAAFMAGLTAGGRKLGSALETLRRKRATRLERMTHSGLGRNPCKNPLDAAAVERIARAAERRGLTLSNPDGDSASEQLSDAKELFSTFHGRDANKVIELAESDEVRGTYTALGKLAELTFKTDDGRKVILDFYSESTKLASNPEGTQLYLIGGDQSLDGNLGKFGSDETKDFVDLGECVNVVYFARKSQTNFQEAGWKHKFGEEGGDRPWGYYDRIRKRIYLVGGDYKVEAPGIIN